MDEEQLFKEWKKKEEWKIVEMSKSFLFAFCVEYDMHIKQNSIPTIDFWIKTLQQDTCEEQQINSQRHVKSKCI